MTKKSLNKLLSVVLTLVICFTTVFGCLITANAASETCYTWSDGTVDKDTLKTATIDLTLTAPSELSDGINLAMFNLSYGSELALDSVNVVRGTRVNGTFSAEDYAVIYEKGGYLIEVNASPVDENVSSLDVNVTSITLELTFTFTAGLATQGEKYSVDVAANSLMMSSGTQGSDYYYTSTGTAGVINAGCDHVFDITGATLIETNTVDGYYVYKDVSCQKCGEINPYQVVPATELKNVLYLDGTTVTEPKTTDADGNILITSAAELAWVVSRNVTGNYKVADGIDAIVLQKPSDADKNGIDDVMELADYAQTKAYFESITPIGWSSSNGTFQGTFDGNGVEIYGMYLKDTYRAGLFGQVYENTTIKNIAVKNSYLDATEYAGAMVGYLAATAEYFDPINALSTWPEKDNASTAYLTFEKCVVANCYISSDATSRSGVLMGAGASFINVAMKNCLVYSNRAIGNATATNAADIVEEGICGNLSTSHNASGWGGHNTDFSNSIILDCVPYSSVEKHGQAFKPAGYSNVYTNCITEYLPCGQNGGGYSIDAWYTDGKITLIDKADVKGDSDIIDTLNADNGSTVWFADPNGGYPTFESEVISIDDEVIYHDGNNGNYDGSFMTEGTAVGSGTKDDPYIISTVPQLRYLEAKTSYDTTTGKYFKIKDGIKVISLMSSGNVAENYKTQAGGDSSDSAAALSYLMNLSDYNAVKTYFETAVANSKYNIWGTGTLAFNGHLDFNGATICGMYSSAGLFGQVGPNATFSNATIKSSYIKSAWYAGAVVGRVNSMTYTDADGATQTAIGTMSLNNIVVANCYLYTLVNTKYDVSHCGGILVGYSNAATCGIAIDNCIAYGNRSFKETWTPDSTSTDFTIMTLVRNNIVGKFNNDPDLIYGKNDDAAYNRITNTVVIDGACHISDNTGSNMAANANISNCYATDFTPIYSGLSGGNSETYYAGKITKISASDVEGTAAVDTLSGFDFDNVWSCDGNGGYPTPISDAIPTTSQFNLNLLGANIAYNKNGSFNFNFYYEAADSDIVPVLYVGRADGDGFTKLAGTPLDAGEAAALGVAEGTLRYSIKNISAREIGDTFLPTAVAVNGPSTVWGKSEQISVADYAAAVINDATVDSADKQVAAALVNYGTAAAEALGTEVDASVSKTKVEYHTGRETQPTKLDSTKENSKSNPYIIKNVENLYWLVRTGVKTDLNNDGVKGNEYFKVADDVKALVLQNETAVNNAGGFDALANLTAAEAKEWFDDPNKVYSYNESTGYPKGVTTFSYTRTINGKSVGWTNWSNAGTGDPFQGHFDANGVTIYGMLNQGANGLFASVNNATIENLNIKASYVFGYQGGLIAGWSVNDTTHAGDTTLKNCTASNSCVLSWRSGGDAHRTVGVLMGNMSTQGIRVSNCAVYDMMAYNCIIDDGDTNYANDTYTGENTLSFIGNVKYDNVAGKISNSVILSVYPYSSTDDDQYSNGLLGQAQYSNVYTDKPTKDLYFTNFNNGTAPVSFNDSQIKQITDLESLKGAAAKTNMPNLDWTNSWIVNNGEYPTPAQSGATSANGRTIYWDGSVATRFASGTGEASDPYIISTAAELAYLIGLKAETADKYYKVADGISNIVLQPESKAEGIMALGSAAEVKAHFEGGTFTEWVEKAWEQSAFCGTFDGNGATVYGLYSVSASNAGLFSTVDAGATIKNIGVKNSYIVSQSPEANYQVGAIAAVVSGDGYGVNNQGVIWFDKCTVANCYMYNNCTGDRSGVIIGAANSDVVCIDNALVYGNDATFGEGKVMGLSAAIKNNLAPSTDTSTAKVPAGLITVLNSGYINAMVRNSIVLGSNVMNINVDVSNRKNAPDCYSNVYTDGASGTVTFANSSQTYTDAQIKAITAADLKGDAAQSVVDKFNTANGSTVWYVGNSFGGYPGFAPAKTLPDSIQAAYDALTFDVYDNYDIDDTDNIKFAVYTTSVNLKNNPYLGITFAFNGEYKENRDDIQITLAKEDGTVLKTADQMKIPAYVEGEYISGVNGWTNKKNAGKYHLYTLNDLAIYDLCEPIVITMKYGDTTVKAQVSLSGFGNDMQSAYLKTGDDYYANCAEAVKALLYYTQSLKACYGK